jgi:hypothetical protein
MSRCCCCKCNYKFNEVTIIVLNYLQLQVHSLDCILSSSGRGRGGIDYILMGDLDDQGCSYDPQETTNHQADVCALFNTNRGVISFGGTANSNDPRKDEIGKTADDSRTGSCIESCLVNTKATCAQQNDDSHQTTDDGNVALYNAQEIAQDRQGNGTVGEGTFVVFAVEYRIENLGE